MVSKVLATTRQRVLYEARELWNGGYVSYDSETTGLSQEDQVIQWAVCDQEGKLLGSSYVKPTVEISEGAFKVHGICEQDLVDAPSFAEAWPKISALLTGRIVVIYNAGFDLGKIWSSAKASGIEISLDFMSSVCAMELFARFYGEVHEYYGTYTWQQLNEVAIPHLGIVVPGQPHSAAHDAAATALLIKKLAELADKELPQGWHPPVWVKCAGGCGGSQECAEESDIWYCAPCGVKAGLYHYCPGCARHLTYPAIGITCEDLCEFCLERLEQERMLLTGAWHWCPDHWYPYIVETPDLDEPCEHCQRQRAWKRQAYEAERARQERIERERKERRRVYAKEYRQRRKEREQENRRRAAQGLPPLEPPTKLPAETIFLHQGHQFQRQKDQHGQPELYCLKCDAVWSRVPRSWCAGVKTYRGWQVIPEHLKTRTQLLKERLQPAPGQKATAVMDGAFDRYSLYDKHGCVPVERKQRSRKKPASNETQA